MGIDSKTKATICQKIDREKAIEIAYAQSNANSIIALLGKGPDEYQIIGNSKACFSEREILELL